MQVGKRFPCRVPPSTPPSATPGAPGLSCPSFPRLPYTAAGTGRQRAPIHAQGHALHAAQVPGRRHEGRESRVEEGGGSSGGARPAKALGSHRKPSGKPPGTSAVGEVTSGNRDDARKGQKPAGGTGADGGNDGSSLPRSSGLRVRNQQPTVSCSCETRAAREEGSRRGRRARSRRRDHKPTRSGRGAPGARWGPAVRRRRRRHIRAAATHATARRGPSGHSGRSCSEESGRRDGAAGGAAAHAGVRPSRAPRGAEAAGQSPEPGARTAAPRSRTSTTRARRSLHLPLQRPPATSPLTPARGDARDPAPAPPALLPEPPAGPAHFSPRGPGARARVHAPARARPRRTAALRSRRQLPRHAGGSPSAGPAAGTRGAGDSSSPPGSRASRTTAGSDASDSSPHALPSRLTPSSARDRRERGSAPTSPARSPAASGRQRGAGQEAPELSNFPVPVPHATRVASRHVTSRQRRGARPAPPHSGPLPARPCRELDGRRLLSRTGGRRGRAPGSARCPGCCSPLPSSFGSSCYVGLHFGCSRDRTNRDRFGSARGLGRYDLYLSEKAGSYGARRLPFLFRGAALGAVTNHRPRRAAAANRKSRALRRALDGPSLSA